ncbi:MAG: DEAD/DEAH box helicase [Prevotella sp.]|nr:DEAD/DEAH box helicase [Prevotella sp.]
MKFEDTYLSDDILDALYDMRFVECTPIQEKCIPEILNYYDIIGVAQTGTGKTAAYLLPILSLLSEGDYPNDHINCVIMSPTRELAQQIDNAMQGFSYYLDNISSVAVYGGNDGNRYDQETKGLRMGASIVIATPGRLLSHIRTGNVDLSKVSFFVLDEADRMLDMGFYDDIMQIVKQLPDDRQTIMFSATMPPKIQTMARALLHNHKEINIAISKPAEKIAQSAYICYEEQKVGLIKHFAKTSQLDRTIIFCGKKERVKVINRELKRANINCLEMHSDLTQQERDDVMYKFKAHIADVLVATDIVARGIDIDDIKTVINFDVPNDAEDYVHRIGRTARAENSGYSITLVSPNDMYKFHEIETFLGK